jgi:hypothetical protein
MSTYTAEDKKLSCLCFVGGAAFAVPVKINRFLQAADLPGQAAAEVPEQLNGNSSQSCELFQTAERNLDCSGWSTAKPGQLNPWHLRAGAPLSDGCADLRGQVSRYTWLRSSLAR